MNQQDRSFTIRVLAVLGFLIAAPLAFAADDAATQAADENIKPVGTVVVADQASASAAAAPAGDAGGADKGKQVYDTTCMACHATGAAGAPKVGDKAAWAPRIAQGADTLHTHAINGIRAMPPRGTCAACSDDDLKAAVDYMVSQSK